ncbi:MAG: ATP-binding protein [Myxococcota bacterium]
MNELPLVHVIARFPARPEGLAELHATFDRFFSQPEVEATGLALDDRLALRTAAGELGANIIVHACGRLPDATMSLELTGHRDRIEIAFEDPGEPYIGPELRVPEVMPAGGMGLAVIQASVDAFEYSRSGGTNRWRIVRTTGLPECPRSVPPPEPVTLWDDEP